MALAEDEPQNAESGRQGDTPKPKRHRTFAQKWRLVSLPNKIIVLATAIIAVSNFVYTVVALRTLSEIRSTSKDTHTLAEAAKQSADTLIAGNRPWLDLQPYIAGPLTLNKEGEVRIILRVDVENIGHSPAVRVPSAQEAIQLVLLTPNPWQELRKMCEQATAQSANPRNRGTTYTIFPGKPYRQLMNLGLSAKEVARSIGDLFPEAKGGARYIYPAIAWCVAYRADFSEVEHRTGYVWELKRKTPTGIVDIERNSTLPMNELVIQQVWPLGAMAD